VNQGNVLAQIIDLYTIVVFVAVIVSWVRLPPSNPVVRYTRMLTEPLLAPLRRIIPPVGGLDFSPWVLLILLRIVRGLT
jgi:YggT family protein